MSAEGSLGKNRIMTVAFHITRTFDVVTRKCRPKSIYISIIAVASQVICFVCFLKMYPFKNSMSILFSKGRISMNIFIPHVFPRSAKCYPYKMLNLKGGQVENHFKECSTFFRLNYFYLLSSFRKIAFEIYKSI